MWNTLYIILASCRSIHAEVMLTYNMGVISLSYPPRTSNEDDQSGLCIMPCKKKQHVFLAIGARKI